MGRKLTPKNEVFKTLNKIIFPGDKYKLSLKKNFAWILGGSLIYSFCQWGLLVTIAKFGTAKLLGQFALGLAISAPIIMFTNLQLRAIEATDARNQYKFGDYLGLRISMTFIFLVIVVGLICFSQHQFQTKLVVLGVALFKSFEALSDIVYGYMQKFERMDYIGISLSLRGIFSLIIFAVTFILTQKLFIAILGLSTIWFLVLIFYDLVNLKMWTVLKARVEKQTLLKLFWTALPLGIVAMLVSLSSNIPRYFIVSKWGESDLGYFASLAYIVLAIQKIVLALGESIRPRLAKYYAEDKLSEFKYLLMQILGFVMFIGVFALIISFLFGKEILTILYQPEYAEYVNVFIWLMLGGLIYYLSLIFNDGMIAAQYFKIQMPIFISVNLIIVISCIILVPSHGILGAAIALGLGRLTHLIWGIGVNIFILNKKKKNRYSRPEITK